MNAPSIVKRLLRPLTRIPWIASWRRARRVTADAMSVANSWTEADDAMLRFYRQFLKPGDVCFDVGANIGNRVKIFVKLGARVVAVEPQKECAAELRRWYGGSGIVVVEKALGESKGRAELLTSNFHMVSSLSPDWIQATKESGRFAQHNWQAAGSVEVATMDDLIAIHGAPRFAKIDVEGFELNVIKGLSHPVKFLSLEFTPETKKSSIECLERLSQLGRTRFNFIEGESMNMRFAEWLDLEAMRVFIQGLNVANEVWGDIYVSFPDVP